MAKQIQLDGVIHSFPDDASDDEISQALMGGGPPPQTSDFAETGAAAGAGMEALGRTAGNMLATIGMFAPSYVAEKIAGNPEAAMTALGRGGEWMEKLPRVFDQTQATEEKIGKAFEAFTQGAGSAVAETGRFLAGGELDPVEEARQRFIGEVGSNLIPIPFLGKGKAKPVEVKPTVREGFTERFDTVRQRDPALKDLSDAQIVETLEQRAARDNPATLGDQGQLFTPDELNPERRQRLNEWQKEEDTRAAMAKEAEAEAATGMKDMFGYRDDPKFLTQEQMNILSGEKKFTPPPALDVPGIPAPDVMDSARSAVRAMEESPLGATPERIEVVKQEVADILHQEKMLAPARIDPTSGERLYELNVRLANEEKGRTVKRFVRQSDLENQRTQLAKQYSPDATIRAVPMRENKLSQLVNSMESPKRGGYEPMSRDEGRWYRQETVDKAVADALQSSPKGIPLVDALRVVEQHGHGFQKAAATLLRSATLADNALASFGDNPVRRISIESDRRDPTPYAYGVHFPRSNESLVRRGYNAAEILIHEAGHQVAMGHISKYLGAKKAGLKAGDVKSHIDTLNLQNRERFRAIEWLDTVFNRLAAMRMHPDHYLRTLGFDNAFKDLHEFAAEIPADPGLRKWLSELKMKDIGLNADDSKYVLPGKPQSLLNKAIVALKRIWDPMQQLDDTVYASALDSYYTMLQNIVESEQYYHFDMADGLHPATPGPKDFLPPELKHLAKYIDDKPTGKVQAPEQAIRAVESPATRSVLDMFTPDLRPWEEVRTSFEGLKDISGGVLEKIGQRVVSGGKMYSWIKQHEALKWAVDIAYDAKASVESRAQELLHHPETGLSTKWQNLSSKEQASLWETIHAGKRAKKTYSAQELADRGLTSAQIDAYTNARKILDDLWTEFNAERLAKGMDPVAPVEGYWPSRWQGNWEMITREKRADGLPGKILRVDRANSRGKLEKLAEKVRADGKYEVDNVQPTPRAGELKDSFGLFNHLAEAVGRDTPEGRVLSSAMDRYAQELADTRRLFRRHYEASSGVEGYLGDTEGASSVRNAKDALRSVEGYVQDGLDWMYTQRASRELSGFLREAEGMGLKNVGAFARLYWDKLNNHEGKLAHLINRMTEIPMESLGYDRNLLKSAGLELKSQATLLMLAYFKPIFIAAQFVQPHQFVGPLIQMMEGRLGRSSKSSMFELGFKAHADTTSALMGSFEGKDGAFRQSAIDYLRKNRIIDPHFMETANTVLSHQQRGIISHLQGASLMAFAERYARTNAFFQFSRWLKEVEPTMGQSKVFSTAAELAEGSMVNYRRMERAQLFHDLGIVGDMASGLTTFKMNLASQLYMYMKEALVQKNPKPAMTLLSMMAIYAGAMGLPMREELDRLINYAKSVGILSHKAMTPTEALLRFSNKIGGTGGDVIRYGPFSAATGIDISPTFSAGALVPDVGQGLLKGLMPVGGKLVDVGMEAANVAGKGLGMLTGGAGPTSSDWGSLGKAALPSSAQWALERAQQNPKTGIVPNPTREMEGTVRRPKDLMTKPWIARMLSARTTKESTEVRANQQQFGTDQAIKAQQDSLIAQGKKLQADGRDWTKAMKAYTDLGGDPTTYINAVRGAAIKQNTTTEERNAMDAKSRQKAEKYLRLRSMYRD